MGLHVECIDSSQTVHRNSRSAGRRDGRRLDTLAATYHYVRDRDSDGVTGLTPAQFEAHIKIVKQRYRVVTAEEYVASYPAVQGLALITFDDGLADQWAAASILDEHGVPAVFFVPMRPYSHERDRWCSQHLLHALADELGWDELERRVEPHLVGVAIDSDEMNRLYHYEVPRKRRLKYALAFALSADLAADVLREVNSTVGLEAEDWYMTPDELRQLQDAGHSLGGHGFDHLPYTTLTPKAQAGDMHRAVRVMNDLFGSLPRPMAYPFGRFTPTTEAIARGCGYTFMFSTDDRVDAKYITERLGARDRENHP